MFVCLSPGGQSLTVGESAKDKLLVGTVNGVFSFRRTTVGGTNKKPCCPTSISARSSSSRRPRRFSPGVITVRSLPARDSGKSWEAERSRHRR